MPQNSSTTISAVTCLYDIGRQHHDGRGLDTYLSWLNKTLGLPLRFDIFLDPGIDRSKVRLKPDDVIHQVALEDFPLFAHRSEVEAISRSRAARTKHDLTFRLPTYSLLIQSKLEMIRRIAEQNDVDGFFWLDAGLSRFLPDPTGLAIDGDFVSSLGTASFAVSATRKFARHYKNGAMPKRYVGTCTRLVTACDFYVARKHAASIATLAQNFLEREWLANGLWDNEQVAFGYLLANGIPSARIIAVSEGYGVPARYLFGLPPDDPKPRRSILTRLRTAFTS